MTGQDVPSTTLTGKRNLSNASLLSLRFLSVRDPVQSKTCIRSRRMTVAVTRLVAYLMQYHSLLDSYLNSPNKGPWPCWRSISNAGRPRQHRLSLPLSAQYAFLSMKNQSLGLQLSHMDWWIVCRDLKTRRTACNSSFPGSSHHILIGSYLERFLGSYFCEMVVVRKRRSNLGKNDDKTCHPTPFRLLLIISF
jgi:hypothetical protein